MDSPAEYFATETGVPVQSPTVLLLSPVVVVLADSVVVAESAVETVVETAVEGETALGFAHSLSFDSG